MPQAPQLRFRHPWRPYQQRVLAELERHLQDRHLHLVAPPGSGKTVLGLEVLCRLGHPALVLAPTITVRDQWIARLRRDFLAEAEEDPNDSAISTELLKPARFTFATYQALFSLFRSGQEEALVAALKAAGVATLAVDEAHHLRSEWWRCLDRLKSALQPTLLALTGTPPYDAPQQEWNRYATFCGEVDEEIGVPELVQDRNLCPHQDLLYLYTPDPAALAELERFDQASRTLVNDLALDAALAQSLGDLPWVRAPKAHLEQILKNGEFCLAVLILLQGSRQELARPLIEELGLSGVRLPLFDRRWAEVLLQGLLFDQAISSTTEGGHPPAGSETRGRVQTAGEASPPFDPDPLHQRLRAIGAIERRRVILQDHPHNRRLLESGPGLLQAVADIVATESRELGERLRLLVLTDHIRPQALPRPEEPEPALIKPGAAPLFEHLRRLRLPGLRLAILTGSLIVLPAACRDALFAEAAQRGIDPARLKPEPLWHAPDHLRVEPCDGLVALVTALFTDGRINALIGTASLLGEGWDAPAVNTLVLASRMASYVGSNQMRGRAIRVLPGEPEKAANIWHLACVAPVAVQPDPAGDAPPCRGGDAEEIARRFRGFVGLTAEGERIESGIERLGTIRCRLDAEEMRQWNRRTMEQALRRDQLHRRWDQAIGPAPPGLQRLVRELRLDGRLIRPRLWLRPEGLADPLGLLPPVRWWRRRRARRQLLGMARAVAGALAEGKFLSAQFAPRIDAAPDGTLRAALPDAPHLDQVRFVAALGQLFQPPEPLRYLLLRKGRYYAVPAELAGHKRHAARFAEGWKREVGRAELIFTQNDGGRLHLLRAREQALAEHFDSRVDIRMRWGGGEGG